GRHPLSAGKREAFRHGDRARRAGRGAPGDARRLAGGQRRPAGGPAGLHGRGLCRAPAQGRAGAGRDDPAHRGGDRQEPGEDRQVSIERDTSEGSSPSRRGATHVFAAYVMLLSILPLLGLGFASFEISRSALQNEAERHLTQLLHERKRFIDLQTEQVEGLIANVSGVEAITTGLAAPYDPADDYTRLLMQARIGYILNGYVNLKGLVSIDIFARNGAHYHVGDTLDVGHIRRELLEDLRRQAAASTRPVHWAGIVDNVNASSQHARVITAAKALYSFRPGAAEPLPLGLLLVNYDAAALQEPFGVPGTGDSIRLA